MRRRNRKKQDAATANQIFADDQDQHGNVNVTDDHEQVGTHDFDGSLPMPPPRKKEVPVVETVDSDSDAEDEAVVPVANLPKKKKKKKSAASAMPQPPAKKEGIKTLPLIFLIIMTGTTLLPALLYGADYLQAFAATNNMAGQIGFRLGIGAVPRKRVLSFYEKHDPNKLLDVPTVLSKYYGEYPVLIKKLERKYQDYGYFLGWEEDEAAVRLAMEQVQASYEVWLTDYWNRYAPQTAKTAARNIRYNVTFLIKKGRKVWKKHVWPVLEPVFGVPGGAAKQKRQDAADASKRKGKKPAGTRRKKKDFRDDEEE